MTSLLQMEEILPLKTLKEVEAWKPPSQPYSHVPIAPRTTHPHPRILVCHDMKGGYLDDRFIQGSSGQNQYRFFHWPLIDCFIYFSHNLVTIPPMGWIHAAHKNGVSVLGTIITEWKEGEKVCQELLSSEEKVQMFVDQLALMTKTFGFDGWLLNIENKVCQPDMLLILGELLTSAVREAVPVHGQVLWYDSVTAEGKLHWQDQLNQRNRTYFDACNGIFLNYNWKPQELHLSRQEASDRAQDVFVGVDVFGRNCYSGGGFNTHQAVKVIIESGLAIAIFAPGWTHEVLGPENFVDNEYKFWSSIAKLRESRGPSQLPLSTSFCQGYGERMFHFGRVVSTKPWFNLGLQELQPACHDGISAHFSEAYFGGSCIRISKNSCRVFNCHLQLSPHRYHSLEYIYKLPLPGVKMELKLLDHESCSILESFCPFPASQETLDVHTGWVTRKFILLPPLDNQSRVISSIAAELQADTHCLLGYLKIQQVASPKFGLQVDTLGDSAKLTWESQPGAKWAVYCQSPQGIRYLESTAESWLQVPYSQDPPCSRFLLLQFPAEQSLSSPVEVSPVPPEH